LLKFPSPQQWGMIAGGIFQPITSQTLLELNWEYIYTPFASREKSCNPKFKKVTRVLS
jgi:hypothetical protein